ncbi:MAG: LytTR family DNA-binding domain-containing protein [Imperialibacter sp.]|uniref:LytR/AlgR family response regulator transcription factor n=1 Tax=Imperialibacter sp. TaxID=2038411 RepID=UPI0032F07678
MTSKKLTASIVEDEIDHLRILSDYLVERAEIEVIGRFSSVEKSIEGLLDHPPDLLFLDVELPDGSGFDILDAIKNHTPKLMVIFTTGHEKYAVEAIRASAFDFVTKPLRQDELNKAIERAIDQQVPKSFEHRIEDLLFKFQSSPKVRLNTKTGFLMMNVADIIFCQADGNYTTIWFGDWKKEVSTLHLGLIEQKINHPDFLRVSRSLLLNINYLVKVDRKDGVCVLEAFGQTEVLRLSERSIRVIGGLL